MNYLYNFCHSCGVSPSKPFVPTAFFPTACEKYIIIQNSNLEGEYEYIEEVMDYIIPLAEDIKIIQIKFSTKDKTIPRTKTYEGLSLPQFNFLVKNAVSVLTNSPYSREVAAALSVPNVLIINRNKTNQEQPSWYKDCIEKDKNTYAEDIAKDLLNLSKIDNFINSLDPFYCGDSYKTKVMEVVPNFNPIEIGLTGQTLNLRSDWTSEMKYIKDFIYTNHVNLITDKRIDLQPSKNLIQVNLEVTKNTSQEDIDFYKNLTKELRLYCRNKNDLQKIRLKFIDEQIHEEKLITKKDLDIDQYICNNTIYKSSKMIISNKKTYTSKASMNKDIEFNPTQYERVIDCEDFWADSEHIKLLNIKDD